MPNATVSMTLDPDQQSVVDHFINDDFTVAYVVGPPGYGKTAALRTAIDARKARNPSEMICTAGTTSVAAVLLSEGGIEATTLHSWLQIGGDSMIMHNETLLREALDDRQPPRPRETDLLIVDEASMLTVQNLTVLDLVLRWYRNEPNKRFGGIKLVLVGDPMQLPPVPPTGGPGLQRKQRAHVTSCLQSLDDHRGVVYVTLTHPHRCDNLEYQQVLRGFVSPDRVTRETSMHTLITKYQRPDIQTPHEVVDLAIQMGATVIAYTNDDVDACNEAFRARFAHNPAHQFEPPVRLFTEDDVRSIPVPPKSTIDKELAAEEEEILVNRKRFFLDVEVREGQILQLRANHTSKNGVQVHVGDVCVFNGCDADGNAMMTRKRDGADLVIGRHTAMSEYWKLLQWSGSPFIPANAATVHLTQGQTIDGPVIFFMKSITWDFNGNLPHILYVALSRVTDPKHMVVTKLPSELGRYALSGKAVDDAMRNIWGLDFMSRYPTK